jgi:rare lipoprotein A
MKSLGPLLAAGALCAAAACAQPETRAAPRAASVPTTSAEVRPAPRKMKGKLSYYGRRFAGRPTASGEPFDPEALTMAHRSLPFGTRVRVTNPRNGKSVVVEVNDRGPVPPERIADLSLAAARRIGMLRRGVISATLEVLPEDEPSEPR